MQKFICIHGHFYQPPRENPWSGVIELQESAAPYHDWNERIAKECYTSNTNTAIWEDGHLSKKVNNYAQINFNFGPTLLSWMEKYVPKTYELILEADKESLLRFSGHGAAIAQVYNHMIMPLANQQDKETQVIWGIKDFEFRFKRKPEGMWLSETAVNLDSLEVLARHGIVYTILSPAQAHQVRRIGDLHWKNVEGGKIDTHIPYICHLPSGKTIHLFFYDGPISNEVAFGDLLKDGVVFAHRLIDEFLPECDEAQLVHIANDGETYGHHHAFGNMALSFMYDYMEREKLARTTIYGEFLANNPAQFEVCINEDTSWSCFHGVERWRAHCGCCLKPEQEWSQQWRQHLREALDWLRDRLEVVFIENMSQYYDDPWSIRNDYIQVLLDQSPQRQSDILWVKSHKRLLEDDKARIIALLEMQRHAMLMFTSCGWFFDDISGLETIQILQYAARGMQLAKDFSSQDLESEFKSLLEAAMSNIPQMKNGKTVYESYVETAMKGKSL